MKLAHTISISVFATEDEDVHEIERALKVLVPFDYETEKIEYKKKNATGFSDQKIKTHTITLRKEKHTTKFLQNLLTKLSEKQRQLLLLQKESRLDKNLNFFIRLNKPDLIQGKYTITDSGDCYHIKIHVTAFPANRDKGMETVAKILTL
jgi:RNA binding exosome subunit